MEKQSRRQLHDDAVANESQEQQEERDETVSNGRFTSERGRALAKRQRLAMSDLPLYLEKVTGRGLRVIDGILKLPLDEENGPLIRAQVTAALGVISSQLRADEARLKRQAHGDALQRLLKIIEKEKHLLSADNDHKQKAGGEDADSPVHYEHMQEHSVPVSANDADGADHAIEIPSSGIDIEGE